MVQNADSDDVGLVPDHGQPGDAWSAPLAKTAHAPVDHPPEVTGTQVLKYTTFDDRPGSTHNLVVSLVPPGAHVLEVGCATGYMSEVLRQRLGCTVVGVELDPAAAAEAAGRADRVVVGDIEALDWDGLLPDERFDAVVFADVLEHLRDPAHVLEHSRNVLTDDGVVVASLPNVAHISVRLALLAGEFRYRETGLLDDTHMRFFTRASLQDLFEGCGLSVTRWLRTRRSLEESEVEVPSGVVDETALAVAAEDAEATTYQFVVRAVPAGHASIVAELRQAGEEREAALRETLAELSEARASLLAAEAGLRARDEQIDRLHARVEALGDETESLAAQLAEMGAALERVRLVRLARGLDARAPALAAALRRLHRRSD